MASVAPSPEVVVERSVVAGSVVAGGVVAGGAGDVVAGSPQHFCSYCGVWMSGDPESLRRHYEGARHTDRVAKKKEGTPCWAICCGNCCASCACGDCSCSCGDGSGAEGDCVNPFAVLCGDCSACGDLLSCCGECTSCLCENALSCLCGPEC